MTLTVHDIIEQAATIERGASIQEAITQIRITGSDRLYLVDSTSRPLGVVSDFTLLKAVLRGESCQMEIDCLAAPIADILTPEQPLEQVALFFRCGYRTQMAVISDGQLLGIVRRTQLLFALEDVFESHDLLEPAAVPYPSLPRETRLIG
ncbi:MAG TPA: CBS domain-containing protein [Planctomycetaceae bacterium]|nr:CBS domain-containing protein [Planctomycetaceae bacterium]